MSVAEAFEYAKAKVVQAFQQKGLLLTEHAVLDDGGEGRLASALFLGTGRAEGTLAVDLLRPGDEEAGRREAMRSISRLPR